MDIQQQRTGSAAKPTKKATIKRPDIQGLRAVAVLLVVANHLGGIPTGGFVGVDVFFVISGYLITGLLVREAERRGAISSREFYARRVRRIIPMAALVLLVTNLAAGQLLSVTRAKQTMTDSIWALLFGANLHFSAIGTDYFQQHRPPSAVEHFWSLSVEEQFYVVWPALIVAAVLLARRFGKAPRRVVLLLAVGGSLASLAYGIALTATDQTSAYFSTPARAWELGFGAVLAVAQPRISALSARLRAAASWLGLTGVVAAVLLFSASTTFPGSAALLPVVGAGLILGADDPVGGIGKIGILNNRVAQYLGDISYSLYLWHFPCIVLALSYYGSKNASYYLAASVAAVGLSVVSFHVFEDPIRSSRWLSKKSSNHTRRSVSAWQADNEVTLSRLLGVATALVVVAAVAVLRGPVLPLEPTAATARVAAIAPILDVAATTATPVQLALQATAWSDFQPSLAHLDTALVPQWLPDNCLSVDTTEQMGRCVYGNKAATQTAYLIGDSIGVSYAPALIAALGPTWKVQLLTHLQCPSVYLKTTRSDPGFAGKSFEECYAHRVFALAQIAKAKPDLVVTSSRSEEFVRFIVGGAAKPADNLAAWQASTQQFLTDVAPSTKRVVIIGAPPYGKDLATCDTPTSKPADCFGKIPQDWSPMNKTETAAAAAVPGVKYVNPLEWFCYLGSCPAVVDNVPVFWDSVHLTNAYSQKLGPLLRKALA